MIETAVDYSHGLKEFENAGLETIPSVVVRPPRIALAPVAMECRVTQIVPVEGSISTMILGKVLQFHIREDLLRPNGLVDTVKMKPVTRLGGAVEYTKFGELFHLELPDLLSEKDHLD